MRIVRQDSTAAGNHGSAAMPTSKSPKKSETLEIRLPHVTKLAFMARCRDEGRTASDAVRAFIQQELQRTGRRSRRYTLPWWQALAAALMGLALGAVAAPSLAHQAAGSRAMFEQLDRNHDGGLSFEEFHHG